eukprot:m.129596 g.129596  ORF g.129596 m.129596 type:complete len:580 (+) comp13893_c2_seq2:274-2013(+)
MMAEAFERRYYSDHDDGGDMDGDEDGDVLSYSQELFDDVEGSVYDVKDDAGNVSSPFDGEEGPASAAEWHGQHHVGIGMVASEGSEQRATVSTATVTGTTELSSSTTTKSLSALTHPSEAASMACDEGQQARHKSSDAVASRLALCPTKAGMEGVDKVKANQIILEKSKGSRFYQRELQKTKETARRIACMQKELKALTQHQLQRLERQADADVVALEATRDLSRVVVHVDMDAFYAAVEERDNPKLKGIPVGIGGMGMLSTANYEARKYGVRSAMPGYIAKELCPNLLLVKPRGAVYVAVSQQIKQVLAKYDPDFKPVSLDESYLDLTPKVVTACRLNPTLTHRMAAEKLVQDMRREIHEATQLTASAGIAVNRMLAKICSDMNKPNGQFYLPSSSIDITQFMATLPIRKVPGIGKVTEQVLCDLGVTQCSDILSVKGKLKHLFSDKSYRFFLRAALGISSNDTHTSQARKSISTERTFHAISAPALLASKCSDLCRELARRVANKGVVRSFKHQMALSCTHSKKSYQSLSKRMKGGDEQLVRATGTATLLTPYSLNTPKITVAFVYVRMCACSAASA